MISTLPMYLVPHAIATPADARSPEPPCDAMAGLVASLSAAERKLLARVLNWTETADADLLARVQRLDATAWSRLLDGMPLVFVLLSAYAR